jgi:hypothetical protein
MERLSGMMVEVHLAFVAGGSSFMGDLEKSLKAVEQARRRKQELIPKPFLTSKS